MNRSQLFEGTISHIYSSSLIIVILILMFIMSLSLFLNRRKKAYFSLTISLFIVIIQHGLFILVESLSNFHYDLAGYFVEVLKVLSFILINMGIYQLYNPSRAKQYLLFYGSVAIAFVVSLLHFSVSHWFHGSAAEIAKMQDLGLDLYLFALLFICYFSIAPRLGQTQKYQIGLTVYFFVQIALFINKYLLQSNSSFLAVIANFLPVVYYLILFVILFERVVELLQASYTNSITDGLTGLYNRRYFVNRVTQYAASGIPVSVIFADIDNFKKLNDMKGHQQGDEALRKVARIMKDASEDSGICGRYGGEEFVILITEHTVSTGELAEMIRKQVETEAGVTLSIGYSRLYAGISAETLIKQADQAMYKAKTSGKNKVVKFMRSQAIEI